MRRLRINEPLANVGMYLSPVETIGQDTNGTTISAFNRFTQEIFLTVPFLLEAVLWDVDITATYNLELVDSTGASPAILKTLASGVSLTGGGVENTINVTPTLIMPGKRYLSLYCATQRTQRRNSINIVRFGLFSFESVGLDGGSPTTYSIPAKLVGCYYKWMNSRI